MVRYLLRRVFGWLMMIVLATNLTYFLANFYLKPRSNFTGRNPPVPEATIDANLQRFNLNDKVPILDRWWIWIKGVVLHWDWGTSPTGDPVNDQVAFRIWVSAELILGATVLMAVIGIAIGVHTATRQYKVADRVGQGTSIITMNIPIVVAALGIVLLAIKFNQAVGSTVFYVVGSKSDNVHGLGIIADKAQHLTLPTLALVLTGYAGYHFLQRSLLLDTLGADYVRMARSKGLTKSQAVRRHALRTSLIPVATQLAFSIPGLFTGAILTESIFAWEGMGKYFSATLAKSDVHGVVAIAAFGALMTAIGAILADIVVVVLDPRVRVS